MLHVRHGAAGARRRRRRCWMPDPRPKPARRAVDEAWATLAGARDDQHARTTASSRRRSRARTTSAWPGELRARSRPACIQALVAAQQGDPRLSTRRSTRAAGYLNTIFYLSVAALREGAGGRPARLRPRGPPRRRLDVLPDDPRAVAAASPAAAETHRGRATRAIAERGLSGRRDRPVYAALNEPAVLAALGIPADVPVQLARAMTGATLT